MRCLDKKLLRHDALTQEEIWRRVGLSEDEINIHYKTTSQNTATPLQINSDDLENIPISQTQPRKITPSELHFSIGDHTTKTI